MSLPCGLSKGGEYFDRTTQSCKLCAIGMFQKAWKSKPEDCVNEARQGSQDFYCEKDVPKNCVSCDHIGRYQDVKGKTACLSCPEHAERPIGSNFTSISDCKEHVHVYMCKCKNICMHKYLYAQVFVKGTTSIQTQI